MSNNDEFMDKPKSRGLNASRITLVAGTTIAVLLVVLIYALFQKPGGDNITATPDAQMGSENKPAKPNSVSSSDDSINKIVSSTTVPNVNQVQTEANGHSNNEVPPIMSKDGVKVNEPDTVQRSPDDEMQRQIAQARNQAMVKKEQQKYAAYGSKSLLLTSFNGKNNASSGVGSNNMDTKSPVKHVDEKADDAQDDDKVYSSAKLIGTRSPYELKAGTIIPLVLYTPINSELSGHVVAIVRESVYDTKSGKYLLVPQGAKLYGKYSNQVAYGSTRIGVAWNRIVYPNGYSIPLQALPGSDLAGFEGLTDLVDNHYWKLFGTSFIMGVITAGMQYSQNNTNANVQSGGLGVTTNANPTPGQTLSGSLGQQLGQTGLAVTNKMINVAPTIIIRQGEEINVMITADLILKPYKD